MSDVSPTVFLPAISAFDAADDKLASFMSDLGMIRSNVARFAGDDVSLDDAVFLKRSGIVDYGN